MRLRRGTEEVKSGGIGVEEEVAGGVVVVVVLVVVVVDGNVRKRAGDW